MECLYIKTLYSILNRGEHNYRTHPQLGIFESLVGRIEHRTGSDGFGPEIPILNETEQSFMRPNSAQIQDQFVRVSGKSKWQVMRVG